MAGPTAPDTLAVIDSISGLLTALKLRDGVTPAYATVIEDTSKDYTEVALPAVNIIPRHDDSKRHAHGGTIVEAQEFEIRTVVDYTDKAAAFRQVVSIRDVLMPLLEKYAVLPNTTTVYHSQVKPKSADFVFIWLKPNWYRGHTVTLLVSQYYVIPGGIQ